MLPGSSPAAGPELSVGQQFWFSVGSSSREVKTEEQSSKGVVCQLGCVCGLGGRDREDLVSVKVTRAWLGRDRLVWEPPLPQWH